MKRAFVLAMLLALSACGREPAKVEAAQPGSLKEQFDAMSQAEWAPLVLTQVKSGAGGPHACDFVNRMEDMGIVPTDAAVGSVYAQHIGARAFSVQCTTADAASQAKKTVESGVGQYLVLLPADSMTAVVLPCVPEPNAENICWWMPRQGPAPAATPPAAPAQTSP